MNRQNNFNKRDFSSSLVANNRVQEFHTTNGKEKKRNKEVSGSIRLQKKYHGNKTNKHIVMQHNGRYRVVSAWLNIIVKKWNKEVSGSIRLQKKYHGNKTNKHNVMQHNGRYRVVSVWLNIIVKNAINTTVY
jgi:hypothetical protein